VGDGLGLQAHDGLDTGVVLGHKTNENTNNAAEDNRVHDAHFNIDEALRDGTVATEPEQTGTDEGGVAKSDRRVVSVLQDGHREDPDDGGDVADETEENGHHDVIDCQVIGAGDDHGGDDGAHEGLEDVSAHAGHVADVVADVVRNDTGVSRVVFWNARLNLADKVRTDVSRFGVNTAANTSKERNGRGPHAESSSCGKVRTAFSVKPKGNERNAEQPKTAHGKPHDGTAVVRYRQSARTSIAFRSHGRSTVSGGGRSHA
tara:strand:- start:810 stop:1589 length:780 start_codon:yes stop_codon:yes gene_type:complete